MALNGELGGWIRTIVLGIAIGTAYADLRGQVGEIKEDVAEIKTEFKVVANNQASRFPVFSRLLADFDRLVERVAALEGRRGR